MEDRLPHFVALASDYDGTLAHDGVLAPRTIAALERLKAAGRRLLMVTGREMPDLMSVCDRLDLFDLIVAENGALLYEPATRRERPLAPAPPEAFVARLREAGVTPFSVGRVIVATRTPYEGVTLDAIRDLGLELEIIFNKGAVMVLPAGVNKATGLAAALAEMGLSARNVVAAGDAENDHAFLAACGLGVAMANALPMLKERADWVTEGARGDGVIQVIERMLADDLAGLDGKRQGLLVGTDEDGIECRLSPRGETLLIAGTSGGGKSTTVTALVEQAMAAGAQTCVLDPEGDYSEIAEAVVLGDAARPPPLDAVEAALSKPDRHVVVNLLGVPLGDRPGTFAALAGRLHGLECAAARPHWLVLDEAHHILPADGPPIAPGPIRAVGGTILVTVEPHHLSRTALAAIDAVLVIGKDPRATFGRLAEGGGPAAPEIGDGDLPPGEGLFWRLRDNGPPRHLHLAQPSGERRRHVRKYAEGRLNEDEAFVFRGPDGRLALKARNLVAFLDMADGVDDETWRHHLGNGDVARWMADVIKDRDLADEVARIARGDADAAESRARVRAAIETRYTAPS
jgi:HAD superfamily hydrolase (TIGR01484 family)